MTATVTATALDQLAERFCSCTLPRGEWTHEAHLRVGAWHVHHHGPQQALSLLRQRIRRLNESHGTINSPSGGYHETITAAYVRLIAAFFATLPDGVPLDRRVEELLAGELAARDVLLRHWSRDLLMSARARAEWVPPDVSSLPPLPPLPPPAPFP